jgi:hypothetical protein
MQLIIAGGNIVKSIASSVQLDAQAQKVNRPGQSTILENVNTRSEVEPFSKIVSIELLNVASLLAAATPLSGPTGRRSICRLASPEVAG